MTKQYELTYTVSKNTTPEEASALFDRAVSYLPQVTASTREHDFDNIGFYAEPETIDGLKKKLKLEPQIKKYLIAKSKAEKPFKARRTPPAKTPAEEEKKVEKVELKEIDQKLKEIFGE